MAFSIGRSPKEEVSVNHRPYALMTDCLLDFMACLIYWCTAGYHILHFGPFDMQIKIPFHVSVSSSPRGAIIIGLYDSRQHWPWIYNVPIFPIVAAACAFVLGQQVFLQSPLSSAFTWTDSSHGLSRLCVAVTIE